MTVTATAAQRPATSASDVALKACGLLAVAVLAWIVAPLLGYPWLAWPALVVGIGMAIALTLHGTRAIHRADIVRQLQLALAGDLGGRTASARIIARRWSRGWPGSPRRISIRYSPTPAALTPDWAPQLAKIASRLTTGTYRVTRNDPGRGRLELRHDPNAAADQAAVSPAVDRARRVVTDLIGPTAAVKKVDVDDQGEVRQIDVTHTAGPKLVASGYRSRIDRTVSSLLPGRWRAQWDLENDRVRFQVRPTLPDSIWLEEIQPPAENLMENYGDVEIPFGVDEDGTVMAWRPAQLPQAVVVGGTGSGKALASTTPIATPTGWTLMGDLAEGDWVFDESGLPCRVTAVFDQPPGRPCNEVEFSDGSILVADDEHLWHTNTRTERRRSCRPRPARQDRLPAAARTELRRLRDGLAVDQQMSLHEVQASVAGISAGAVRAIAREVAVVGYRALELEQTYKDDPIYSAPSAYALLLDRASATRGWLGSRLGQLRDLQTTDETRTVGRAELYDQIGGGGITRSHFAGTLHQIGVEPLGLGTKTVTRRAGREHVYDASDLLTALINRGEEIVNDQRPVELGGIRTTVELAATLTTGSGHANHSVPVAGPLDLPPADLPIPPYALGAWLGDGTSSVAMLTTVDDEILDSLRACGVESSSTFDAIVYQLRWASTPVWAPRRGGRGASCSMCGDLLKAHEPSEACATCRRPLTYLRSALTNLGVLNNKHIPANYLRSSIAQRRELLAGLLDTDGTVGLGGQVQFDSTREILARGALELAMSLGYRATMSRKRATLTGVDCGPAFRVSFSCADSPFSLRRKTATHQARRRSRSARRTSQRYVVDVRPVSSVPVRCITVDSESHLYLAGKALIPTHNTSTTHALLVQWSHYGWPIWVADGKAIEFLGFRDWPNVQVVASTPESQVAVIHRAWAVMEQRYSLVTRNMARVEDFEPLLLFVDEYADLKGALSSWYDGVKQKGDPRQPPTFNEVASIIRKGRTARVHVVLALQRPDVEFLGGEMRDNLGMRISVGRISPQGAQMMWEHPGVGVTLPRQKRGRAIAMSDDNLPVEMQCYRTPDPARATTAAELEILDRLRPATSANERLLILEPDAAAADLDTSEVTEPRFSDYAEATWVRASDRPDLDPLSRSGHGTALSTGRELSSPMAILGLTGATRSEVQRPMLRELERQLAPAPSGGTSPDQSDPLEEYGTEQPARASDLTVGDLIEHEGEWVVVEDDPLGDVDDPDLVSVPWRGDNDDCGDLIIAADEFLSIRRPKEV